MNYEQLLELLRDSGGSRSIDAPAENSLLRGALSGLYSPSMAYLMKLANAAYGSRGLDTTAELKMRMGSLGSQDSTQNILRSIFGQQ